MIAVRERFRQGAPVVAALVLFVGALEILRHELSTYSWATITADLPHMPSWQIVAAVGVTALNYLVLTGYDFLAFASIGRQMAAWRIGLASFVAYAIANNVGFAMLSGTWLALILNGFTHQRPQRHQVLKGLLIAAHHDR